MALRPKAFKAFVYAIPPLAPKQNSEARVGFAPTHNGFADRRLAAWLPRQNLLYLVDDSFYGRQTSLARLAAGQPSLYRLDKFIA